MTTAQTKLPSDTVRHFRAHFRCRHTDLHARGMARVALWFLRREAGKPIGQRGDPVAYAEHCDRVREAAVKLSGKVCHACGAPATFWSGNHFFCKWSCYKGWAE